MTFKQFSTWCNERAADGRWWFDVSIACIEAHKKIRRFPFWRREKEWQKLNASERIIENIVHPTNCKIEEMRRCN